MSSKTAIKVENLGKCYQIYDQPRDRLKQMIMPRLHRLIGRKSKQYYRDFWALDNVSFEVRKGETVGIIGRNGSGKSTLLQMICGTLTPSVGSVTTHGRIAALLELGSGFNPEFTGRENVYLNAALVGLSKEETDMRFDDIIEFADIGDFIGQPVKTYSSGMLVRLAFSVIAHVDADILIIDEALAVGDAFFTQKCMRFLRGFMKEGTVLFVSHDTGAVVNLCSRALQLNNGKVAHAGTAKEVAENYLVTLYEQNQKVAGFDEKSLTNETENHDDEINYRDVREQIINASNQRNDIEVFHFNPDCCEFGTGNAEIISVRLLGSGNRALSWLVGGEDVTLEITCRTLIDLQYPIVGFEFKDKLGQVIFADNTYLACQHLDKAVSSGGELAARFDFRLPVLPVGDYSITAALAEGTQENHIQHHWKNDALIIRSHSSSVCFGLVGLPMKKISLQAI